jgi:hypothetical protein
MTSLRVYRFHLSTGRSLEFELRDRALQDVCRSAQPGRFVRVEFKPQHAIYSFSIQNCRKAHADVTDPAIVLNECRDGKNRVLIAQNGRSDAD